MADREKYIIKVEGKLVEVSQEVYFAYFRMERQERWQEEKQREHGVMSYDALDDGEMVGLEDVVDTASPGLEDAVIAGEFRDRLRNAIASLPKEDRELIQAIYYEEMSERAYAKQHGISQNCAYKRRRRILSRLRAIMNFFRTI